MTVKQDVARVILDDSETLRSAEIIEKTGAQSPAAVYTAISELRRDGMIDKDKVSGCYIVKDETALRAVAAREHPGKPKAKGERAVDPAAFDSLCELAGGIWNDPKKERAGPRRRRRKKRAEPKPAKKRRKKPDRSPRLADPGFGESLVFSLTEKLDVRLDRLDGQGKPGFISRRDACVLLRALDAWRLLLEGAA